MLACRAGAHVAPALGRGRAGPATVPNSRALGRGLPARRWRGGRSGRVAESRARRIIAAIGPTPGISRSRRSAAASSGWRARWVLIAASIRARRRASAASAARMSVATSGWEQSDRRFFSCTSMRLSRSRRWTSRRRSSRSGPGRASGAGFRSAPGEHGCVALQARIQRDPVGLRQVERAGEVPGVQRVEPHARPPDASAPAAAAVAVARRLVGDGVAWPDAASQAAIASGRLAIRISPRRDRRCRGSPSRDRRRYGSVPCWAPVHVFGLTALGSGLSRSRPSRFSTSSASRCSSSPTICA